MDKQVQDSPQAEAPQPQPKQQKRRGRKSSTLAHDSGAVSDSAALSASPAPHGTPKPRHHQKHAGHAPSPRTNPRTQNPATPLKEGLWAGPAFHSSPDPSSLPIPRFFRQSTPAAATASPSQALAQPLDDDEPPASPSRKPTGPHPNADILGRLFAADRKERQPLPAYEQQHALRMDETNSASTRAYSPPQKRTTPDWREHNPASPMRPFSPEKWTRNGSPQHHSVNPVLQQDRAFNGQTANSVPSSMPKDAQAMADDLKRILKIGPFS